MTRLLCWAFGHSWRYSGQYGLNECRRCNRLFRAGSNGR